MAGVIFKCEQCGWIIYSNSVEGYAIDFREYGSKEALYAGGTGECKECGKILCESCMGLEDAVCKSCNDAYWNWKLETAKAETNKCRIAV